MTKKRAAPKSSDIDNLNAGIIRSTSVGLKTGEIEALDKIAADQGIKRNGLMRLILRDWLVRYLKGEVDLSQYKEVQTVTRWKLPDKP